MPYAEPPPLADCDASAIEKWIGKDRLPPVEQWNPTAESDSFIRICSDGQWLHRGTPISRKAMVRAFSRILRRDGDSYFLVTPYEKQSVAVDDAPLIAVEMETHGQGSEQTISFRTATDDLVVAGPDHALRFESLETEPRPYIHVRNGLDAKIARPLFYRLVDLAVERDGRLGVWSSGTFFPMTEGE